MRNSRVWRVIPMVLLAIVGACIGVVATGLVVGSDTETGASILRFGVPLMLVSTVLLVTSALLSARARRDA